MRPTIHYVAGRWRGSRTVTVRPAARDGCHASFVRLSFAQQPVTLELAVGRLPAAWEPHAETLAASPARS